MDRDHPAARLWHAFDRCDWVRARTLLTDDFVADWPQTCEWIRGPDAFIALNAAYPGRWRCFVQEVVTAGDRATARVTITDGMVLIYVASMYRLRDGKISEAVEIFGDAGEPPFDRSRWTERYPRWRPGEPTES